MLTEAMKRQFDSAFDVLAAAIGSFAPDQWRRGASPYDGPGRATVHALQCAEFYTSEDEGIWARLGKPVWEMSDDELPTQDDMLQYLADARSKTAAWIDSIGDQGLDEPWREEGWLNALDRIAYALRHLQHHTGEICAYQKQLGLPPAPWK